MKKLNMLHALLVVLATILTAATSLAAVTTNYEYDDQYRLAKVSRSDGTTIEYRYDEAGNRTRKVMTLPPAPVAAFQANSTNGITPLNVNFTDLSTGFISSWLWDFGDGTPTSSDQNPVHTYQNPGKYTVSLTVTGAGGNNKLSTNNYISVLATLSIKFVGSGQGNVTSDPAGIAANTDASAWFASGTPLLLHAAPTVYSIFSGWSAGPCAGTGDCTFDITTDTSVTATFDKDTAHSVRIDQTFPVYFTSIASAYLAAFTGETVMVWGTDFTEILGLNLDKAITIKGGYDSTYSTNSGFTILHGVLTIGIGSVVIDKFVIQ